MPNPSFARSYWSRVRLWIILHKIWTIVIALVVIAGGWSINGKLHSTSGQIRYVLGTVASSTIIASITGSGQVSPSNQVDIKPRQSGTVTRVLVSQGDHVNEGQAIAYIDAAEAEKGVRDAKANLQSAELSLAKLRQPATALTMTQAQNALSNAQDALSKLYSESETDIVDAFLDVPDIITGIQGIVTGTNTNTNQQWNIDYYENSTVQYDIRSKSYRDTAADDYVNAKKSYDATFEDYQAMKGTPDRATLEKLLNETYATVTLAAKAAKSANAFIQFYEDTLENHNLTPSSVADTALTNLNTYTGKLNTHLSTLLTDINSLKSDQQSITEKQQSLEAIQEGADTLDVQVSQLSVTKAQNALTDAQNILAEYTVRAPFSGTIAKVDIKKGDQASSGTAAATIITTDQLADLSVNEVDAAKLKTGQKATLTFDAIDGLSIAGTVASVDTLGTVTQGVVSYDVKIDFISQDTRVKPGMTVNASIIIDTAQDAITVPSSAVKTMNGQSYVQVFEPTLIDTNSTGVVTTQTPQNVPVTTGISDDTNVQILSGLTVGKQVVIRTTTGTAAATTRTSTGTGAATGARSGTGGGTFIRGL